MKILLSWLRDYVDIRETPERIADALLMSGTEVEAIFRPGENLRTVVIGQILDIKEHPNASDLTICCVDVGKDSPLHIVCGAKNVRPLDKVPVAQIGSTLPSGAEIRKASIRGVDSLGMLCSMKELGISDDHSGIYILPEDSTVGQDVLNVLGRDEAIFDLSVTPNRGDELSHLGIARELSAIFNLSLGREALDGSEGPGDVKKVTSVQIEESDLCHRYGARVVENVKVGKSPNWLRDRLEKVGIRSINNIVDVTNYVMLDIGHPMHAFDFDKLSQNRIFVRKARQGEKIKTLDGGVRTLSNPMLVIADAKDAVALAGVMGGKDCEVTERTTRVLLEAAVFDPVSVRKTSKTLGLVSESSYRFERGVNVANVPIALNLAARLISDVSKGQPIAGMIDSYPNILPMKRI
ncbi:phenylalanine--tRNA ligase subunit beta, partial [bacterium]|nr:phenylalanine--tRNA ligase subunit beta [bacterium]